MKCSIFVYKLAKTTHPPLIRFKILLVWLFLKWLFNLGYKVINRVFAFITPNWNNFWKVIDFFKHLFRIESNFRGGRLHHKSFIDLSFKSRLLFLRGTTEIMMICKLQCTKRTKIRFNKTFKFRKISFVGRAYSITYTHIPFVSECFSRSQNCCTCLYSFLKLLFYFKLCFNFLRYDFWILKLENLFIHCQKQNNPMITIWSILDFPLFSFNVPLMPTSDCSCDLIMGKWSTHLGFT